MQVIDLRGGELRGHLRPHDEGRLKFPCGQRKPSWSKPIRVGPPTDYLTTIIATGARASDSCSNRVVPTL